MTTHPRSRDDLVLARRARWYPGELSKGGGDED